MEYDKNCINCSESEGFAYVDTKANGDIWECLNCGQELESPEEINQTT